MSRRRSQRLVLAALVLAGLIGIGFASGGGNDESDTGFTDLATQGDEGGQAEVPRAPSVYEESTGTGVAVAGGSSGGREANYAAGDDYAAEDGSGEADAGAPPSAGLPQTGYLDRIIKDGRMEVQVPEGRFDEAFAAALGLAGKAGGQVVASQSNADREGRSSGEVTIRVRSERFEQLLGTAGTLGDVRSSQITSQDVSGEFTDLESRLRHLQAQERFYLDLLNKARVVGDAIAVNQHLSSILAEMEQVKGRLRLLDERTTFSRLTIALFEPGDEPIIGLTERGPDGLLSGAWRDALRGLQQTLGALLVGSFTVAPLAALALLVWALWRRLRPRPAGEAPRPADDTREGPLHVG